MVLPILGLIIFTITSGLLGLAIARRMALRRHLDEEKIFEFGAIGGILSTLISFVVMGSAIETYHCSIAVLLMLALALQFLCLFLPLCGLLIDGLTRFCGFTDALFAERHDET